MKSAATPALPLAAAALARLAENESLRKKLSDESRLSVEGKSFADVAGELVWHLPVLDEMRDRIRSESPVADLLQHNWVRWGSASWAAAFLMAFTGDKPLAHLDIAGPSWNGGGPWGQVPSGATGYGVATLVQYVLDHASQHTED